jgi:hypothetical protein
MTHYQTVTDLAVGSTQRTVNGTVVSERHTFNQRVVITLSRLLRTSLLLGGAVAVACSDGATAVSSDTTASATTTTPGCFTTLSTSSSLSVGQVVAGVSGPTLCVTAGAAAAEYALIPFNGSTVSAASFDVIASGTTAPSALPNAIVASSPSFDRFGGVIPESPTPSLRERFEAGLRRRERVALPQLMNGARRWARQRATPNALRDVIPNGIVVGQRLQLNANADVACSAPIYRTGRVVAITNRAIVVADTGNPAGGYTDAEYASFGTTFDTLIDPLDRQNFGDPSDIDNNGRVLLFFTKTVNDLTPPGSSSFIGGFFYARDLFPLVGTVDYAACGASNVGEMFYVMVPDPSRGGVFSKANVASEVYGTLVHEYQHLINASRRMYVNSAATDFEETWLNEGLSHIAEELLFYRVSGLAPRQNIDASAIRTSAAVITAFNDYESDNFGRYEQFLDSPSGFSPYTDNDSLATRGATWSFLRYAADHRGSADSDTWMKLVNSPTTGISNLQGVFGNSVVNEIRDWGTSVLVDDDIGADIRYQQPSWDFRAMYAALLSTSAFPLMNSALTNAKRTVTLEAGSTAYLRFALAAGSTANIQWTGAPSTVQFTIVRTK